MEWHKDLETLADDLACQDPWYGQNLIYPFFESYVLDVIDELPAHRAKWLQNTDLQAILETRASEWKDVLCEVLCFSATINVAILDAWYRLLEIRDRRREKCDPVSFARDFVERFFAEDSDVDVWTPETLEKARHRIESIRSPGI